MCKVSVIIPVYKAEQFIERCVRSLFDQTLDSIEYIFVDDQTPDDSIAIIHRILQDYPKRQAQVHFITMHINSRQAAARSAGLSIAKGEYIIHCDPDDWVDQDYYSQLYDCAIRGGYDLVTADIIYHLHEDSIKIDTIQDFTNTMEILRSNSFFFLSLCNQLIRASLIRFYNIDFYPGVNFMEDFGFNARIYFFAKSVGHVHSVYYHYNKTNDISITNKINSKEIVKQRIKCLKNLETFFNSHNLDTSKLGLLQRSKRDVKDLFLEKTTLKKWQSLFPDVCNWVIKQKDAPVSYRFVYWLAHHVGTWPMKLYLML